MLDSTRSCIARPVHSRQYDIHRKMDGEPAQLPPPPPLSVERDELAEDERSRLPAKKPARSIRDFFGQPMHTVQGEVEQHSGVSGTSAKEVIGSVATADEPTGKPEGDTSVDSITVVEPISKRKTAGGTTSGRKKTGGRKVTDEDAEMREMEAAARKKQRMEGKAARGKGKAVAVNVDVNDGMEGMMGESIVALLLIKARQRLRFIAGPSKPTPQAADALKKRGRPRKQPQPAPQEIIDISSPVKLKPFQMSQPPKRRGRPPKASTTKTAEEFDLTHTEDEDEVRVLGPSRNDSTASPDVGRNRVKGTRSAESMWDGAVQVDEDEAPPEKKKANLSMAGKPMHSFFARPKTASFNVNVLARTDEEMGHAQDQAVSSSAPIVGLESQGPATAAAVQPVHSMFSLKSKRHEKNQPGHIETINPFFTPTPRSTIGRPGWAQHATIGKDALWPNAEEIEVPSEYAIERPRLDLPRRARQRMGGAEDAGFWARLLPKAVPEKEVEDPKQVDELPEVDAYAGHPAITSLGDKETNGGKTQLWIDKYRPLDHAQVLGNEVPAKYLVDWLGELAIGIGGEVSEDRRHVQRKVIKRRKRQSREDDWIVQDNEPIRNFDDDKANEAVDDTEAAQQTGYPDLSKRLTNSILLQGPYGSGKTASIYAAATELGWEVFEVYPGIGKRSGASLSQLVGDVGKNHLVGKGRPTMPPSPVPQKQQNPLLQAFAKVPGKAKAGDAAPSISVDLTDSPGRKARDKDFGFVAPAEMRESKTGGSDVRQSLILLEEVDILFEEDKGFWAAVVALIEESKRPVIMTCNGEWISSVKDPAADL